MPDLANLLNKRNRLQKDIIRLSNNPQKVAELEEKLQQIDQQISNLGG